MSKFSNLLKSSVALLLCFSVLACSQHPVKPEAELKPPAAPTETEGQVQIDKGSNSIKMRSGRFKKPLFDWPVWEARMTRGFLPKVKRKRKRPHKGIDLAAPRGSAVMASHDGVIIYTGSGFKGYGKMVMIESNADAGTGFATLYGHLDKIVVYEGKKVRQGEVIGALGNTGRSSGPHLHFEIRKLNGPIDPRPLLPAGVALTDDVDNGAAEE